MQLPSHKNYTCNFPKAYTDATLTKHPLHNKNLHTTYKIKAYINTKLPPKRKSIYTQLSTRIQQRKKKHIQKAIQQGDRARYWWWWWWLCKSQTKTQTEKFPFLTVFADFSRQNSLLIITNGILDRIKAKKKKKERNNHCKILFAQS